MALPLHGRSHEYRLAAQKVRYSTKKNAAQGGRNGMGFLWGGRVGWGAPKNRKHGCFFKSRYSLNSNTLNYNTLRSLFNINISHSIQQAFAPTLRGHTLIHPETWQRRTNARTVTGILLSCLVTSLKMIPP